VFRFILVSHLVIAPLCAGTLVDWSTEEGNARLSRAKQKTDFFSLANNFAAQTDKVSCGPTTMTIVLNAMRANTDSAPLVDIPATLRQHAPKGMEMALRRYSIESFFAPGAQTVKPRAVIYGKPINGKTDFGLQLRQLHAMFMAFKAPAKLRIVDEKLDEKTIKQEMIANLGRKGDYVVVNYSRKTLAQPGGGHISPVGAYDAESDSFLVLDVNPATANWTWIEAKDLINAMHTLDTSENRGYLLIGE
jgi:hypothetical protein